MRDDPAMGGLRPPCDICGKPVIPYGEQFILMWDNDPTRYRRIEILMKTPYGFEYYEVDICGNCMARLFELTADGSSVVAALLAMIGEQVMAEAFDEGSNDVL